MAIFNTIVRVGGGFLNLDEFLEVYGPGEVDKANKSSASNKSFDSCSSKL